MNWIKKNKKIVSRLEDIHFYAFKEGLEVTNKDIEKVIGKHDEFTTKQFLYLYNNYNQVKRTLRKTGLIEEKKYNKKKKKKKMINFFFQTHRFLKKGKITYGTIH